MLINNYTSELSKNPLFKGIEELEVTLKCLSARVVGYEKDNIIILSGSKVRDIGIMLSGSAKVMRESINGDVNILTELTKGDIFAESFVCAGIERSPVTVQASKRCTVLSIDLSRINGGCTAPCNAHMKLLQNLVYITAKKSVMLSQKIEVMAGKNIREKVLIFLNGYKDKEGTVTFTIPYNRQELADYLSTERSALSRELSRMQEEGLIKYNKNNFTIYN